ncbi:DUF4105 domain-containing protein [Leptospira sarikeiensis]|uniref:DUF4105 domain-containing protein n=1 Tax=Leptospira sarikeiensis TaxID=2484943 RepID=A0A4R9KFS3_9LEPT|nr:DUF4105 domain-containing protein [Leptospira sarikeiensis]TGL64133.1 DUF4105 domain-containing protein [Leptospira sarikeiensis]
MPLKKFYFFIIFFSLVSLTNPIHSDGSDRIQEWENSAISQKLWEDRYWILLVHYIQTSFGDWVSEADSPSFFLSEQGKKSPKEELLASLKAILTEDSPPPGDENWMHPICKFPERKRWLQERLSIPEENFPKADCSRFKKWFSTLNPKGAKVVFASYYMNAPASIFGHTLLKLDSGHPDRKEILEYSVNYAANSDPNSTNVFIYSVLGLFGGYPGSFSLFPYYMKISEYNDMESRDLWEYELDLNQDEINRMTRHLWELGSATFDYYFLDENCSYHLLSLIEVARPKLSLRNKAPFVIPGDTIKKYLEQEGLVRKIHYRPSLHSKIVQKLRTMNEEEKELYKKIIEDGDVSQLTDTKVSDQIRVPLLADTIIDSFRYKKSEGKSTKDSDQNYRKLLLYRTKLPTNYDESGFLPVTQSPHIGHGSSALYNEVGSSNLGNFLGFGYRAAVHDLLNTDTGYPPNSSVDYFSLKARYYQDSKKLHLEEFHLVRILSLTPYNSLGRSMSYFVDSGADSSVYEKNLSREKKALEWMAISQPDNLNLLAYRYNEFSNLEKYERITNANLETTFGYSFQDEFSEGPKRFLFSIQAGAKLRYNGKYDTNAILAPQAALYWIANFGSFKAVLSAHYYAFSIYNVHDDYKAQLGLRYAIQVNHELRLETKAQRNYNEVSFSYVYQF